jgi:hypothetical protein
VVEFELVRLWSCSIAFGISLCRKMPEAAIEQELSLVLLFSVARRLLWLCLVSSFGRPYKTQRFVCVVRHTFRRLRGLMFCKAHLLKTQILCVL